MKAAGFATDRELESIILLKNVFCADVGAPSGKRKEIWRSEFAERAHSWFVNPSFKMH